MPPDDRHWRGTTLLLISIIMSAPNTLTATQIAQQIDAGKLTAEAVVRAHLERIDKRDADVLAGLTSRATPRSGARGRSTVGRARACCTACRWA